MKNQPITPQSIPEIHNAIDVALMSCKSYQVSITLLDNSLRARQRALANIWYQQIDRHMGNDSGYSEAFCKYHWGLRLACAKDPDLERIIRRMLDGYIYDQKIEIIRLYPEWFPVLRDKGGLDAEGQAVYLSNIQRNMAELGIILTSPKERDLLRCAESNR